MPSRVRVVDGRLDRTLEVAGGHVRFVDDGTSLFVSRKDADRLFVEDDHGGVRGIAVQHGDVVWVSIDGMVFEVRVGRASRTDHATEDDALSAPMPATVVRIAAAPGQTVQRGDLLVALEAMKMELAVRAPHDGVVMAVHCREGELVQSGRPLIDLRYRHPGHDPEPAS